MRQDQSRNHWEFTSRAAQSCVALRICHAIWGWASRPPKYAFQYILFGIATTANYLIAAPGFLTHDQVVQLHEARTNSFSSAYEGAANGFHSSAPPFMTLIWKALDAIVPGPSLMLLLQLSLYWLAIVLLLRRLRFSRCVTILICIVFALWPLALIKASIVQNDVLGAAFGLLAIALMIDLDTSARRRNFAIAALLVAIAGLIRFQFFALAIPILGCELLRADYRRNTRGTMLLGAGIFGLAVMAGTMVTATFLNLHTSVAEPSLRKVLEYDIGGTIAFSKSNLSEESIQKLKSSGLDPDAIVRKSIEYYSPSRVDTLIDPPDGVQFAFLSISTPKLFSLWAYVIAANPWGFLEHRIQSFARVLGFGSVYECWPGLPNLSKRDRSFLSRMKVHAGNKLIYGLAHLRYFPSGTLIFKPWPYIGASLFVCWYFVFRARRPELAVLLASGILYEMTFLITPQACDVRYSFFPMACSLFASCALLGALANAPMPRLLH